jgi:SAM-dependent methyltransferase
MSRPGSSYRTFIYHRSSDEKERQITLIEELAAIQAGTTGLRTWTAAYVFIYTSTNYRLHLAHHILHNPNLLHPSGLLPAILELGAGTGFLSILLAQLGANVVASDLGDFDEDEEMEGERRTPLARLQANVELSKSPALQYALADLNPDSLESPPCVVSLDWMDASKQPRPDPWPTLLGEGRTIVAADIVCPLPSSADI